MNSYVGIRSSCRVSSSSVRSVSSIRPSLIPPIIFIFYFDKIVVTHVALQRIFVLTANPLSIQRCVGIYCNAVHIRYLEAHYYENTERTFRVLRPPVRKRDRKVCRPSIKIFRALFPSCNIQHHVSHIIICCGTCIYCCRCGLHPSRVQKGFCGWYVNYDVA
jgi:hypothetical protein